LSDEKAMKTELRGSSYKQVTNIDEGEVSTKLCKDNKLVHMLSTFWKQSITESRWRDKGTGEDIKVNCPAVVREYNQHMGAVDLVDSLIWRYKFKMRSHKLYIRILYHLLDVTVFYSWIICKHNDTLHTMALTEFRVNLAESLCKANQPTKRGCPSIETNSTIEAKWLKLSHYQLGMCVKMELVIFQFGLRHEEEASWLFAVVFHSGQELFQPISQLIDFLCNNKSRLILNKKDLKWNFAFL
jgi:hypothetical protein